MATVPNSETNDFLVNLITSNMGDILGDGSIGVHIGGFWNQLQHGKDADGYPRWQWIDRTPFSFENWSPGEPDEDTKINHFLSITIEVNTTWAEDGKWSDVKVNEEMYGICQKSMNGWKHFRGMFYKITNIEADALEHEEICENMGGQLASAPDEETMNFLKDMMKSADQPKVREAFLGGMWDWTEKKWIWTDGSSWNFENWKPRPDGGKVLLRL